MTRILLVIDALIFFAAVGLAQTGSLPDPPQVGAKNHVVSLTLHAINENGRDTFGFDGGNVAPVVRASPGDVLKITYINDLPAKSPENCAVNPCMDMTNLHFHGLSVSPDSPQDDVLKCWPSPGRFCTTRWRFRATIRRACSGTTPIRMAKVSGKYSTECRERSSLRAWSVMPPK